MLRQKTKKNKIEPFQRRSLSETFFFLLWKKEINFKIDLEINIPNTMLFKGGVVTNWYFTSKNRTVNRKKEENLTNQAILSFFEKKSKEQKFEIVAVEYSFNFCVRNK